MTGETNLLIIWITFTAVALIGLAAVLVWAVRSKQFSNQDAARYLPLKSGIPGGSKAERLAPPVAATSGRRDRRSETAATYRGIRRCSTLKHFRING